METKETKTFNPDEWDFERSSGFAGYRNRLTDEWIYEADYREKQRTMEEDKVWEGEVFRIIKIHTKSDDITQEIVDELKTRITIYRKD